MTTTAKRNRLVAAALLGMTIGNCVVLWNSREVLRQGYGDFSAFYTAGTLVRRGQGRDLYSRGEQWKVQQEFASEVKIRRGPLPYIRPPFEAVLFAPFSLYSYPTALRLWTVLKLLLLFSIPLIVVDRTRWRELFPRWTAGALALGTYPVFSDLLQGQDSILLAFVFAVVFHCLARGNDKTAGFALGMGLFKFHLVLPVALVLWIAGRRRIWSGFVLAGGGLTLAAVAIVGWRGLWEYPVYLLQLNRAYGVGMVTPEEQINFRGLLTLFVERAPYPGAIHWILLPLGLAALWYVGDRWRRAGTQTLPEGFGLTLIAVILSSYYAYAYDLTWLGVPLLAGLASTGTDRSDRFTYGAEVAGILVLLFTPLYWFLKIELHAQYLMTLPLLLVGFALIRRLRRTVHVASPVAFDQAPSE